jgi:hypothetical protein
MRERREEELSRGGRREGFQSRGERIEFRSANEREERRRAEQKRGRAGQRMRKKTQNNFWCWFVIVHCTETYALFYRQ